MNGTKIEFNSSSPQTDFALAELKSALEKNEALPELSAGALDRPSLPEKIKIVTGAYSQLPCKVRPQGYTLYKEANTVIIAGADIAGTMYGVLDVAQHFSSGCGMESLKPGSVSPFIEQRGVKFNIPLDARTPSYSDSGDSAQENIINVWDMDFWKGFLDRLAKNKYNVLTLWSLSPFPSMVRIPSYPDIALDDVKRAGYMPRSSVRGTGFLSGAYKGSMVTIKKFTMDKKIQFWRDVMQYAADRCISVYIFTWNIFTYGTEGILDKADDPVTKDYYRKAVEALVRTYPLLRGIGVTAGENMAAEFKVNVLEDIQWIRETYGQGIIDALKDQRDRKFTLIHRAHMTNAEQMKKVFSDFPCDFEMSFKYSQAHLYSVVKPHFGDEYFRQIKDGPKTWLTVRDDDFYLLPWGNFNFALDYLKNMPVELLRGFYLGPDGLVWAMDYAPRDAGEAGSYFIDRHWFGFALWGRLSYNINLDEDYFCSLWKEKFGIENKIVYEALKSASTAVPLQQRVCWRDYDSQWYPESSVSYSESVDLLIFRNLNDFIECPACPGSGYLSIGDYCDCIVKGEKPQGVTPLEAAEEMERNCLYALSELKKIKGNYQQGENSLVSDIESMSRLGLYYSYKIQAAVNLNLYRKTGGLGYQKKAASNAGKEVENWLLYSHSMAMRYRPQRLTRLRNAVSPDLFDDYVRFDLTLVSPEL
jgi:hypothetical protein